MFELLEKAWTYSDPVLLLCVIVFVVVWVAGVLFVVTEVVRGLGRLWQVLPRTRRRSTSRRPGPILLPPAKVAPKRSFLGLLRFRR